MSYGTGPTFLYTSRLQCILLRQLRDNLTPLPKGAEDFEHTSINGGILLNSVIFLEGLMKYILHLYNARTGTANPSQIDFQNRLEYLDQYFSTITGTSLKHLLAIQWEALLLAWDLRGRLAHAEVERSKSNTSWDPTIAVPPNVPDDAVYGDAVQKLFAEGILPAETNIRGYGLHNICRNEVIEHLVYDNIEVAAKTLLEFFKEDARSKFPPDGVWLGDLYDSKLYSLTQKQRQRLGIV